MDAIDRKILSTLQADPERGAAQIAEVVGLSHTPCWRRIKRMEQSGIIRGRALLLDPEALGLSVSVFAEIRLKQHDEQTLEAIETAVRDRPEIVECFSMSGEADYLLRVIVGTVGDYETFLKKVLLHMPGIGSVNSRFALKAIKMTTRLPI
jgi:Lrp/AsnC family transcriptional regulator